MKLPLKILVHIIFWMVFLLFSITFLQISDFPENRIYPDIINLAIIINTIWAVTVFYLFYFYIYRFFERGQFVKYLLLSLISALVLTFVFLPLFKLIIPDYYTFNYKIFLPPLAGSFILAQCGCLVRGFENWFESARLKVELENKNLKNELELLKSQINPHFLFNSLNNIDMLIRKSPEDASRSLITLSDMLRYMIYETGGDRVPLFKELEYLKNFISLQRLRFKNQDYIKADFPNECQGKDVAPMIFVPFVENAFKHSNYSGNYPVIEIVLRCTNKHIHFICSNYFQVDARKDGKPGGVGLENVMRRLSLLYPEKHTLNISRENDKFVVDLKITG